MDVNIGELSSSVTLTDASDVMEPRAFARLVRAVTEQVKRELAEERRRDQLRLGTRAIRTEHM